MRVPCRVCQSFFFAEDDDFINDSWICSYCKPKTTNCPLCGKLVAGQRDAKFQIAWCATCAQEYSVFPNIFLALRYATFKRDNFTCRYCGRSPIEDIAVVLHIDHLFPRAHGGEDSLANFVTTCRECNSGKSDVLLTPFQQRQVQLRRFYESGARIEKTGVEQVENCSENRRHMANDPSVGQSVGNPVASPSDSTGKVFARCKTCKCQFEPHRRFQQYCGLGLTCKKRKRKS